MHQGYIGLSSEQAPLHCPCEQRDAVHGRDEFWPIVPVGEVELRYREGGGFQKEARDSVGCGETEERIGIESCCSESCCSESCSSESCFEGRGSGNGAEKSDGFRERARNSLRIKYRDRYNNNKICFNDNEIRLILFKIHYL